MRGDIIPPKRPDSSAPRTRSQPAPSNNLQSVPQPAPDQPRELSPVDAPALPLVDDAGTPEAPDSKSTPKHTRSRNKLYGLIGAVVAGVILLASLAVFAWYSTQLSAVDPRSDEKLMITIEPGTGLSDIAAQLKKSGLIRSELAFEAHVRLSGKTSLLQSGSYRLARAENVPAIVKHLTSGNTDTFSLTFLPGATLSKHRQVVIDAGYDPEQVDVALAKGYDHPVLEGKPSDADLEGYIFGETYNFQANATVEEIITRTFDQFETVVKENDLRNKYKAQGFNLYQGITMASIIQREVATAEDAAQVAQVFKLRYDAGMQLGSDVTYQYIADKLGQARSVDLDSPYNTRRYVGLPPGPIASPGLASLKAVGSPAPGDYVYFLSGDDDKTYFARTNEEHEKNIREHCQKKCQII